MRLALLLLVGCTGHTTTIVRMSTAQDGALPGCGGCEVRGAPAPELANPVIEFARGRLFSKSRRVEWIAAGVEWPARSGVVIDARSEIGVLVIQSGGPGTSNGTVYCLRVLDEHTVIVQWRSSWKT